MRAIALSGSRDPEGQTAQALGAFAAGLAEAGTDTKTEYLPGLDVQRCRQCDSDGWGQCKREGVCIIEDDFERLVREINSADLVIFATPVYFGDLSESIRAFLDRLRRISRSDEARRLIEGTRAVGICVAGGGGGGAPACCLSLEKVVRTCGFDLLDVFAIRRQTLHRRVQTLHDEGLRLGRDHQ